MLKTEFIWEAQKVYGGSLGCDKIGPGDAEYCKTIEDRIRWEVKEFVVPCEAKYYLDAQGLCRQDMCPKF